MKIILIILFTIATAKVNAQEYKKIYWKYADSMVMKHLQGDTIEKTRYIDSMVKYNRLYALTRKKLK